MDQELEKVYKALVARIRSSEWAAILGAFDQLSKLLKKWRKFQGPSGRDAYPDVYLKATIRLQNASTAAFEERKTMRSANAKSLNKVRQILRKTDKSLLEKVLAYKGTYVESGDEAEEEESEPEEERGRAQDSSDEEDGFNDLWDNVKELNEEVLAKRRAYFVKKTFKKESVDSEEEESDMEDEQADIESEVEEKSEEEEESEPEVESEEEESEEEESDVEADAEAGGLSESEEESAEEESDDDDEEALAAKRKQFLMADDEDEVESESEEEGGGGLRFLRDNEEEEEESDDDEAGEPRSKRLFELRKERRLKYELKQKRGLEKQKEREEKRIRDARLNDAARIRKREDERKEYTDAELDARLEELNQSRGRRGADKTEFLSAIEDLFVMTRNREQHCRVLLAYAVAVFDSFPRPPGVLRLPRVALRSCLSALSDCVYILERSTLEKNHLADLFQTILRMDDELRISFQEAETGSHNYICLLHNESRLVSILQRLLKVLLKYGEKKRAGSCARMLLEHLYYKRETFFVQEQKMIHEEVGPEEFETFKRRMAELQVRFAQIAELRIKRMREEHAKTAAIDPESAPEFPEVDVSDLEVDGSGYDLDQELSIPSFSAPDFSEVLVALATTVFEFGDAQSRVRALLCLTYHHALHTRFVKARDLLLMSHIQDNIQGMDIHTQILYNRAMCILGVAAFSQGHYEYAHTCLADICFSGRVRELLAQGTGPRFYADRAPEQEQAERRRILPFHMHIGLELLECCHHISAMFLEIPNIAATAGNSQQRIYSRAFRRLVNYYGRHVFSGPPEGTRDYIFHAAMALDTYDWKRASEVLLSMRCWATLPNGEAVKKLIHHKCQEVALMAFAFRASETYDTVRMSSLSEMFDLDLELVHKIINRLIVMEDLRATKDQTTGSLIYRSTDNRDVAGRSSLQTAATNLAAKATSLMEQNERLYDLKVARSDDRGKRGFSRQDGQHDEGVGISSGVRTRSSGQPEETMAGLAGGQRRLTGLPYSVLQQSQTTGYAMSSRGRGSYRGGRPQGQYQRGRYR